MKRETKIKKAKEKAKKTPCAIVGVDVKDLNLTNEEKKQLIAEGFHLSPSRNFKFILTYSQEARVRDIKEKVRENLKKTKKIPKNT